MSTVSADEIDPGSTRGACVGRPVRGVDVRIIAISDGPIAALAPAGELPNGTVGEIIVRGPVVTKEYDAMPEATAGAKIADAATPGGVWHRMGDCGCIDGDGRLWYLGRKAERVDTSAGVLFTEPCEQVFRAHPRARRCALIGLAKEPALVVETRVLGEADARALVETLRALARNHPHTSAIRTFFFMKHLPVDVRHNAKIHRLALAKWAVGARSYQVA